MKPHTSTDAPPTRIHPSLVVAILLLIGAGASLTVMASAAALPASAVERAAYLSLKKPKPTVTTSPSSSVSPTSWPPATETPSPSATATPTSSPSPTATATSSPSPTATTSPAPSPTASAQPSPTASATATGAECTTPVAIDGVTYCTATGEDVIYGRYPDGTPLVLRGLIAELEDRYLWMAANRECPVGMFCAPILDWGYVYFPDDPMPAWDDYIDVWGLAESSRATGSGGGGMRAVGWIKTG